MNSLAKLSSLVSISCAIAMLVACSADITEPLETPQVIPDLVMGTSVGDEVDVRSLDGFVRIWPTLTPENKISFLVKTSMVDEFGRVSPELIVFNEGKLGERDEYFAEYEFHPLGSVPDLIGPISFPFLAEFFDVHAEVSDPTNLGANCFDRKATISKSDATLELPGIPIDTVDVSAWIKHTGLDSLIFSHWSAKDSATLSIPYAALAMMSIGDSVNITVYRPSFHLHVSPHGQRVGVVSYYNVYFVATVVE